MLIAVAFCPHPPVLSPRIAGAADPVLDRLRIHCDQAVAELAAARPGLLLVVGSGRAAARWSDGDGGSLAGFGVDEVVPLRGPVRPGRDRMPLSLTLGAWLVNRSPYTRDVLGFSVPDDTGDADLAKWAAQIGDLDDRLALLVMGDGSARRTEKAPGYLDPRAVPFDQRVTRALATADARALRELDARLGSALLAPGTNPWRLTGHLAGAPGNPDHYAARLTYDEAPFGVGYFVAHWLAP